jgi:hypothetical protein
MRPTEGGLYGRQDLVRAYLRAHATENDGVGGYRHEEDRYNVVLRSYHERMQAGMEQLFGVRLAVDAFSRQQELSFFLLFASTVRSYLAMRTPWSGYLETGLLITNLRQAGEVFTRVNDASRRIERMQHELRQAHLDMLDALATQLLGDRADLVFTAADLRAIGVEDRIPEVPHA